MNHTSTSNLPLAGRVAVVTGASSGMGAAIATRLAFQGAAVAALGRRTSQLRHLADQAPEHRIVPVTTDITSAGDVDAARTKIHDELGAVDLLINAAGIMLPNPMVNGRADEWATMIDTNLSGLLEVTRAFLPDLIDRGEDRLADIVNISSIAAHTVFPDYAVYAATKAAVTTLSAMQRTEVGQHGVRVTNIEPGLTHTELGTHIDNPRLLDELQGMFSAITPITPADVADLVDYVVTRPAHVNLRQLVILPTQQA